MDKTKERFNGSLNKMESKSKENKEELNAVASEAKVNLIQDSGQEKQKRIQNIYRQNLVNNHLQWWNKLNIAYVGPLSN